MTQYKLPENLQTVAFGELNNLVAGVKLVINTTTAPITNLVSSTSIADGTFPSSDWATYSDTVSAQYFYEVAAPYVAPTMYADINLSDWTVINDPSGFTQITRATANTVTGEFLSDDVAMQVGAVGVFVWQYNNISALSNPMANVKIGMRDTPANFNAMSTGVSSASAFLSVEGNAIFHGSAAKEIICVLDTRTATKTLSLYNGLTGLLERTGSVVGEFTVDMTMFCEANHGSAFDMNIYFNKNTFPWSMTQGDIATDLSGVDWKQLNESNDAGEIYPPIIKITTPVEFIPPPYVAPTMSSSTGGVIITGNHIEVTSATSPTVHTDSMVVDFSSGNVYVYQYITMSAGIIQMMFKDDTNIVDVAENVGFIPSQLRAYSTLFSGSSVSATVATTLSGIVVLDTTLNTIEIYSNVGALRVSEPFGVVTNVDMHIGVVLATSPIGSTVEYFFDKLLFPYSVAASDIGVKLAANPNWKQAGET